MKAEGKVFGITVEETVYTNRLDDSNPRVLNDSNSSSNIRPAFLHQEKKSLEFLYESRFPLVNMVSVICECISI